MEADPVPKRFHIDRRAAAVAVMIDGAPDALLDTHEIAKWLGYSEAWIEIGRHRGYGPPFIKVSARRIRYRVRDVVHWLEERTHQSTQEYERYRGGRARAAP
jgi:predicted DNA-binding transcriptional regulator AlpA